MQATEFRDHFPVFSDSVHLCSCSEGALSDRVMVAMSEFMTSWRIHGAPWQYWMSEVDRARLAFAQLIHADPKDVATVSCASEGAFQVVSAQSFIGSKKVILTNDLEFPSVAHVWLAAESRGASVQFISDKRGLVQTEQYLDQINDEVALVSTPLVSYANGLRLSVREIAEKAHRHGARVIVDAYQGAGVVPIDVEDLDCDYLVAGTLKYLLGAPGIAFLWVRPELEQPIDPVLTGWFGRKEPFAFTPRVLDYAENARRFQTGTPAIPAAFAASAGLSLINETNTDEVFSHVSQLAQILQDNLVDADMALYSPTDPQQRGPQVAVLTDNADHLAEFLEQRRIFVSPRGKAIRISLHYYNNKADLDQVLAGLVEYQRLFPGRIANTRPDS